MRVRLTTDRATVLGIWHDGDELDIEDSEALALIKSGQAVAVLGAKIVETAMVRPPENRIQTKRKKHNAS